jgi:choline dehydrogenase-like flavoprotein
MSAFDYDVIVIGSGFGGSVAALRATEKGYRVGVMESGKRWDDEQIPKTSWDLRPPNDSPGSSGAGPSWSVATSISTTSTSRPPCCSMSAGTRPSCRTLRAPT